MFLQNVKTLVYTHFSSVASVSNGLLQKFYIFSFLFNFESKVQPISTFSTYVCKSIVLVYLPRVLFEWFLDNYIYIFIFDFKPMVQCVNTVSSYATPNQSFYVLVLYLHMHLSFLFQVFILVNYFTTCYQHILTYTVINRNYCEFLYQTAIKR